MPILHSEAQVLYARYLKSGMTLEDFCRKHQIPYWDFSDWINRWEKRYGGKFVENATKVYYKNVNRLTPGKTSSYQSNAQSLFPTEFEENNSPKRFPTDTPAFNVSLELPKPGTIIKGAKITLQSGMTINIPRITIKGLVLMAILYEGNLIQE